MQRTTFAAALVGLMLTAVIDAQTISWDFERTAPFGSYATYAWVDGTSVPDALVHRRLVGAIDAELARKGLTAARPGTAPDVLVAYHAAIDRDLQVTGFGSGWGGYRFGGGPASARAERILVGTMIVDIVDARTNTIVWRGTAMKDIDMHASPDKRDKNISRTTGKLFKHYPPK